MAWRTSTSGHAPDLLDYTYSRMVVRGSVIETFETEEDGRIRMRDRAAVPRYCPHCGVRVCSYKNPNMKKGVYCYAHDHMATWTRHYLLGEMHVDRSHHGIMEDSERGRFE